MGVGEIYGCVSRRWVWVESMCVASGCGCKEVYRFPRITYPSANYNGRSSDKCPGVYGKCPSARHVA